MSCGYSFERLLKYHAVRSATERWTMNHERPAPDAILNKRFLPEAAWEYFFNMADKLINHLVSI